MTAGFIMLIANILDFIDRKVAESANVSSRFGGFWNSVMDRFSDLSLFNGRPVRHDVLRDDQLRAGPRRVDDREVQGRVHGATRADRSRDNRAFTNRMAGILWVILVLSVVTVLDRIYFSWRALRSQASGAWPRRSLLILATARCLARPAGPSSAAPGNTT